MRPMGHATQIFSVTLSCPRCREMGQVVWEETASMERAQGSRRRMIALHGNFHKTEERGNSGDPLIVCNACDQIMPD